MTEKVEVRFGGNTSDLDNASRKAQQDIKGVGTTATGLKGTFSSVAAAFKNMFSGTNFSDVSTKMRTIRSEMKELVEGTAKGNIQLGIFGRVMAEAAEHSKGLAVALLGVAVALGAMYTVKKVLEFGEAFGEAAENIDKVSQKLGMSAEEVQRWHGVADQIHMSTAQMDSGFVRLERSMFMAANGGKQQQAVFKELKLDVNNLKSPTEALIAISEKFKDMPDGPKKVAIAMQLMSRAGAQMIPVLNQGKEGLAELMKVADDTGSVMSNELVGAGLAVDEQFDAMHLASKGLKNILFEALAPAIHAVVSGLVDLMKGMVASYRAGGAVYVMVQTLAAIFKVLASIVVVVGGVFVAFGNVAIAAITAIFGPIKVLATAMADVMSGNFKAAYNDIKEGAKGVASSITSSLSSAWGAVKGTATTVGGIWGGMPKPKSPLASEEGDMDLDSENMKYGGGGGKKKKKDNSKEEAKKRLDAYLAELDREEEAAQDDYDKKMAIEQKKLDALEGFYHKNSKEYIDQLKHMQQMAREHAEKLKDIERERVQHQQELDEISANDATEAAQDRLNTARTEADQEVQLGRMSATRRAQVEIQFLQKERDEAIRHENEMFQIKLKSMQDQLALLNPYSDAYRQMNQKIETAERQHEATMASLQRKFNAQTRKANSDAANASIAKWKSIISPITSAMGNALNGLLTRTMTWKQAFISVCDTILTSFVSMGVEMLTNWIATQLGLRAVHAATKTAETATDATANATSLATTISTNIARILSLAPVAGAGAFAATAAIPYVGPILAPGAAAAATGMVLAMAPLAAASGGYDIPAGVNPVTQLHQKEMVLPAHLAEPMRAMLRSAGPRASAPLSAMAGASASQTRSEMALRGGGNHSTYSPTVHGGYRSLEEMLQREGRQFRRWINNEWRNGNIGNKSRSSRG